MKTTILFSLCVFVAMGSAQIPQTVSIQGQLWKASGEPIDDGDHNFTVMLFDAPAGGAAITVCNPCIGTVRGGVFALTLGDVGMPSLPPMDRQYWVSVSLEGEELLPRLALHSVPYALSTNGVMPIGSIVAFAGMAHSVPAGWLLCDGSARSRGDLENLFKTIGTLWGDGTNDQDPATDFNLPDFRGMFMRGADAGSGHDANAHERQPQSSQMDSNGVGSTQGLVEDFSGGGFAESPAPVQSEDGILLRRLNPSVSDFIQSFTPNAAVNYIIRAR